ncbi:MAG TPA: hypothetical protein VH575_23990 [Gemmataceae bacterium]|jgi:hypothetical protein
MEHIVPEKMQRETTRQIVLPPEATVILHDLHRDREGIAAGFVLLACLVARNRSRFLGRPPGQQKRMNL